MAEREQAGEPEQEDAQEQAGQVEQLRLPDAGEPPPPRARLADGGEE